MGLKELIPATAQIDSGCTQSMIDRSFARITGTTIQLLKSPLKVEGCNCTILDQVNGQVTLDPKKIQAIQEWAPP